MPSLLIRCISPKCVRDDGYTWLSDDVPLDSHKVIVEVLDFLFKAQQGLLQRQPHRDAEIVALAAEVGMWHLDDLEDQI